MIEAFELGVALTLETDAAREALNGLGQQLSALDRDVSEFEKRMTAMPSALARLAVPQSSPGNENISGRGEHLELPSIGSAWASDDQRHLQSTANLSDYLTVPHPTGDASIQSQESNSRPTFVSVTGAEGDRMAPMTTDLLGAVSPSISYIMSQATALARDSASLGNAVSAPQDTRNSSESLSANDFAQQVIDRSEVGNSALIPMAERGDVRSSALTGQDDSASLRALLGAVSNQALPASVLQTRAPRSVLDDVQHVLEPGEGNSETGRLPDPAPWSLPLASPSAWTAVDALGSLGLPADLPANSGPILPGEMQADPAEGRLTDFLQPWGNSLVPPTFPYPTLPAENAPEAQSSSEGQGRNGTQPEAQSDEESMSTPLVIHTNVHIDGDVVARVVSEKMVAWMNGPLAGTGGFDARRSYTPVES